MSRQGIWSVVAIATLAVCLGAFGCNNTSSEDEEFDFGDALSDGGAENDVTEDRDTSDEGPQDSGAPDPDTGTPPEDTGGGEDTSESDADVATGPLGACCAEDDCATATKSECDEAGGTFTEGKTCAEVECVDQSVCCGDFRGSKLCSITDTTTCTEQGGTVKENATSCGETQCDGDTLSACCGEIGGESLCLNVEKSTCDQFDGATYNQGKACAEINC